eukprot:6472298-Amphidinium_carterae.1
MMMHAKGGSTASQHKLRALACLVLACGLNIPQLNFARKSAEPSGVRELWEQAQATAQSSEDRARWMTQLKQAYEKDIMKFGRQRAWLKSLELFEEMQARSVEVDESTYSAVLRACSERANAWGAAVALLDTARDLNFDAAEAYEWTIFSLTKARRFEAALKIVDGMRDLEHLPETGRETIAMRLFAAAGLWEKALSALDTIKAKSEPDELQYNYAITACLEAGLDDLVDEIQDDAEAAGHEVLLYDELSSRDRFWHDSYSAAG